jgi:AraC-like DNA-binding protein
MYHIANHDRKPSEEVGKMVRIPSISAKSLGAMPQFVLNELGATALQKTFATAGLPERFLDNRDGYIPEQALANFIAETSRRLGHDYLGLLWAPFITVEDYGNWGVFVLSAPTLNQALTRSEMVMPFHSSTDRVKLVVDGKVARFSYYFGMPDHKAYPDIAYTALASVLSIPKHFLGSSWTPLRLEINIPRPPAADIVEETFGCPVIFQAQELSIIFPSKDLRASNGSAEPFDKTTVMDIARERANGPPVNLVETVSGIIMTHLAKRDVSVDTAARQLDTGIRTLQLALAHEGTSFRRIASRTTAERAIELLGLPGETVSSVSTELGYTSPTNFSRAFKKETGLPPRAFLARSL